MFLIMMVIGLVGLAMMAIPAFARHGTAAPAHGHLHAHGPAHAHAPAHLSAADHAPASAQAVAPANAPAHALALYGAHVPHQKTLRATTSAPSGMARWLPSPRGIFTALALYGAFGNALVGAFHLSAFFAALAAVLPTLVVERFAVRPLWNLIFKFHAQPSASLEHLILSEAMALVPFRNGRGIVSTNREGRIVQLRACLCEGQASQQVRVGDRLRIEDVDAQHERVTVSVLHNE